MSKFRALVEQKLVEYGYNHYNDSNDHTGSDSINWTLNLPMNDELRKIIIDQNIVNTEDLQDDNGNWLDSFETDVVVDYSIEGYPDDEEITVDAVYLPNYNVKRPLGIEVVAPGTEITQLLPKEYLWKVAEQLEQSGNIELSSYDYEGQVRGDYYDSVL